MKAPEITVERVHTDYGGCYLSVPFREQALSIGIRQRLGRPCRAQTNRTAERILSAARG